ncbi:MAG: LacI family transcriptional regulator [Oscillospiraceae bacterium]|nr:LacI family transcriptional regulator [Oscillospiraceae bacterium]
MTIKDIAKNCSVSVSTVSRVLNEHPDVREEVRRRILDEVERSGYIPNNSARDLVKSSSDAIGIVVRGTGNLFFSEVLDIITQEINGAGFTAAPCFIASDADEIRTGAMLERDKKLRGLVFLGGRFDYKPGELNRIGIPFVCCSYTNHFGSLEDSGYSSVSIDDFETARLAVTELIRCGHRQIAAVVPDREDHSISELRFQGYLAALKENGITFDPELLTETGGCFEMPVSYDGVRKLAARKKQFTALFALSDTIGMAAMKALTDSGLRVPEDVSVIAIDGLSVSEYAIPTLTTMVQPAEEMGRESVRLLLDTIRNHAPTQHLRLEAKMRAGQSVRQL